MNLLSDLIGVEAELPEVARGLLELARSFDVPTVGAYHVTCSDETEWQSADVFHKVVVESLLPALADGRRGAFHTMNLGARYEPGALHIAEHHYAVDQSGSRAKLLLVKINSHVAVGSSPQCARYGTLSRYGVDSTCCGALCAMLGDVSLPAVDELRGTFGDNRLAMLRDPVWVATPLQPLFAAVANARLQAARAVADLADYRCAGPTVFVIVPCVTINREADDTELVVGQYTVDSTEEAPEVRYRGLGDVPHEYRVGYRDERLLVEEDRWPEGDS